MRCSNSMRAVVASTWRAFNEPLEGVVSGMYADVRGLVTTGMGNMLPNVDAALALPWKFLGYPAPASEVRRSWQAVSGDPDAARLGWRYALANPANNVRLLDADIDHLIQTRLNANDRLLSARFSAWAVWPADAQMAAHSMTWAMGDWFHKFPKCCAALDASDFAGAAAECRMQPEAGSLVRRNDLNQLLLRGAAVTADVDSLCWSPPAP
jgi:hypothetical protein